MIKIIYFFLIKLTYFIFYALLEVFSRKKADDDYHPHRNELSSIIGAVEAKSLVVRPNTLIC